MLLIPGLVVARPDPSQRGYTSVMCDDGSAFLPLNLYTFDVKEDISLQVVPWVQNVFKLHLASSPTLVRDGLGEA